MIRKNVIKEKILSIVSMVPILVMGFSVTVYASTNTWADNLSAWVTDGAKAILVCVIAAFSIKFIAKRQIVQFISFLVLAAFVSVIAFGPDKLQTLGNTLWGIIFK